MKGLIDRHRVGQVRGHLVLVHCPALQHVYGDEDLMLMIPAHDPHHPTHTSCTLPRVQQTTGTALDLRVCMH